MAKKPNKKSEKKPAASLESQLKETVVKAPAAKVLPATMISKPKAKKQAETLISPPRAGLGQSSKPVSRYSRLKSSLRLRNDSSLAPSFLSTQNPKRGSLRLDPIRRVQAIILAIFLVTGGSYFLLGETFRNLYGKAQVHLSSAFDWRAWNEEVFTQNNELKSEGDQIPSLLPSRDLPKGDSGIQAAMVSPPTSQGFEDVLPKSTSEPKKKVITGKELPRQKASLQKKTIVKKKESSSKKSSKRKVASKASKGKKSH